MLTPDTGGTFARRIDGRFDMTSSIVKFGLPLLASLAAGCATTGTGSGSTPSGADPVTFSWNSPDSITGTINATLAGDRTYSGQFFQITKQTRVETLEPLWVGWHGGFGRVGAWRDWDAGPSFITHYSGRVVANLSAADGEHMRCKFQLAHPREGMAGGGRGQCQMPDGKTIDATFPTA
jgi:hypothetical protein